MNTDIKTIIDVLKMTEVAISHIPEDVFHLLAEERGIEIPMPSEIADLYEALELYLRDELYENNLPALQERLAAACGNN